MKPISKLFFYSIAAGPKKIFYSGECSSGTVVNQLIDLPLILSQVVALNLVLPFLFAYVVGKGLLHLA
jgi:hypothetical protein